MKTHSKIVLAVAAVIGAAAIATATLADGGRGYGKFGRYGGDHRPGYGMGHSSGHGMGGHMGAGMGAGMGYGMDMMRELDPDGTGKIDLKALEQRRAERFNKFDANGDGKLTLEEYKTLCSDARNTSMVRRFQYHDRDGDGVIGQSDFVNAWGAHMKYMDRDGDGVIEPGEMHHRRGWKHDDDD